MTEPTTRVFFFGVGPGESAGHYLYRSEGNKATSQDRDAMPKPLQCPDGTFCDSSDQREGIASIGAFGQDSPSPSGWTIISFWDRSADRRGGCNANFIACGDFSFDELMTLARAQWPRLFARFKFEVHLRGTP